MADTGAHRREISHRWRWLAGLLLAIPLAGFGIGMQPAAAANVVNYTVHVPVSTPVNPCSPGDILNLSGDIHIVLTSTDDGNGGFHVVNQLNSNLKGISLVTRVNYVSNENQSDDAYARPPFPVIHTHTYDWVLVSQANTPNYVMHMTMHETITANGVPTATVDNFKADCQG